MITRYVEVRMIVRVTVDETKFTPGFLEEFCRHFYPFDTVDEHLKHLAQLTARGVIEVSEWSKDFIEGYGRSNDFGIVTQIVNCEEEILEKEQAA